MKKANAGAYVEMASKAKEIAPKTVDALDSRMANNVSGSRFKDQGLEYMKMQQGKYKTGGPIDDDMDLFEDYENMPKNVKKILNKYGFEDESYTYGDLENAKKELEEVGYTFDYYVAGEPYDLRPINKVEKMESTENMEEDKGLFAQGGYPTGRAWSKEHYNDNDDEDYEIDPDKRIVKARNRFAQGGNLIGDQYKIDMNKNGRIDAEDFEILRNTMNGAWRNEHKHVNHSEDYETRYARKYNPSRTGYKGRQKYDTGGPVEMGEEVMTGFVSDSYFYDLQEAKNRADEYKSKFPDTEVVVTEFNDVYYVLKRVPHNYGKRVYAKGGWIEQIFGKQVDYPTGRAWSKEHYNDNEAEDYEVDPDKRIVKARNRFANGAKISEEMSEERYCRIADDTGHGINEGYVVGDGMYYFETEKALIDYLREAEDEEFKNVSDDFLLKDGYDNEMYYWTQWECEQEIEDQGYYYTYDGEEIEIAGRGKKISGGNVPAIAKKVNEVNRLIELANENELEVIDERSTWQSPMKYKPIKYSNGILYIEYLQLDLYKHNKMGVSNWVWKKDKVLKRNMDYDNPLNDIAKMYRKALRSAGVMFDNGGVSHENDDNFEDQFNDWFNDGNVIKLADGYATQDAQYMNRLKDLDALKEYFNKEFYQHTRYAKGGWIEQIFGKQVDYPTGRAWSKEHYNDNESEDYEIDPDKRKVKARNRFERGGYPTGRAWSKEHYNDNDDEDYEIDPDKRIVKARNRFENGGDIEMAKRGTKLKKKIWEVRAKGGFTLDDFNPLLQYYDQAVEYRKIGTLKLGQYVGKRYKEDEFVFKTEGDRDYWFEILNKEQKIYFTVPNKKKFVNYILEWHDPYAEKAEDNGIKSKSAMRDYFSEEIEDELRQNTDREYFLRNLQA